MSLYGLFKLSCTGHWGETVVDEKKLSFTRRQMFDDIEELARAMLALGVKPGNIVATWSGRSMYANVVIFFAANRLGATATFLDEAVDRETVVNHLDEFGATLLFTYRGRENPAVLVREALTLRNVVDMDLSHDRRTFKRTILENFKLGAGRAPLTELSASYGGRVPENLFGANREALISFTSGSTSGPKPMVFTNGALIASAIYSKVASNVKMWDRELHSWLSYVHLDCPYGLVVSVLAPICGGGEVIMTPDICEENLDYYIGKNPNTIFGIPSLLEALPEKLGKNVNIGKLRMFASGGERLERQVSVTALDFFRSRGADEVRISNGYGVGEALGLISTAVGTADYKPDSVGRIPPGVHVMVRDPETDQELGFNQAGMIYVTGKHILARYYNRPELDAEKIRVVDGRRWVKTGDLGHVSRDGYITLLGRATFFINDVPAKVYYEVVHAAVMSSELVQKAYVVKAPDAAHRFVAYAFVVLKDGVPRDDDTRNRILVAAKKPFRMGNQNMILKWYEVPRKIIFLDDLPETRAGKTDFRELEERAKLLARQKG